MPDNLTKEEKQQILQEILASEEFEKKTKFQDLLSYLVETSLKGEEVKECTIAVDFFGKDAASFDPSTDSSVRAYISNLRKKLEHFYLTKGRLKPVKLTIPKGHYSVEFVKNNAFIKKHPKHNILNITIIGLLLVVLILLFANLVVKEKTISEIPKNTSIWKEILTNQKKTLIVMGDYYFFSMPYKEGRQSYIRDVEINSNSDLDQFINENPEIGAKASKTYTAYLDEHLPVCVAHILPVLLQHEIDYEIKIASEIQLVDLQKFNIIYIGPYKCLNLLSVVTNSLSFSYTPQQGSSTLVYQDKSTGEEHVFNWLTNPLTNARNDYATVVKVAGHNDNIFLMFMSEHDFGNIGTIKYFTNKEKLSTLQQTIGSTYFETLFEVTGVIRTDFSTELIHHNALNEDFTINLEIK